MKLNANHYYYALAGVIFGAGIYIMRKKTQQQQADSGDAAAESAAPAPLQGDYPPVQQPGTAHFKMSEFNCHDGSVVPLQYRGNVQKLMEQLEVLRAYVGGKSIHINSGYRSPAYNAKLEGSAANSMHLYGKAADITIAGMTPLAVRAAIAQLLVGGKIINGGVGSYATFTHYDIGATRRWNG